MKKIIFIFLIVLTYTSYGQEYKDWGSHDVIRYYKKVELNYNSSNEDGEEIDAVNVPTKKVEYGIYEVEVKKVSSKLYQISGIYIYVL